VTLGALAMLAVGMRAFAASPNAPLGSGDFLTGFHAEYSNFNQHEGTNTLVTLTNRSHSTVIVVERAIALGPDGRDDILGTLTFSPPLEIPPTGTRRIPVDDTFPGVDLETFSAPGVRTVAVAWSGPAGALESFSLVHLGEFGNNVYGRSARRHPGFAYLP